MYQTDPVYQIWATSNLLLSMIIDPVTHRDMYARPMYLEYANTPHLSHVDYPRVMVRSAFYNAISHTLNFTVLAEEGMLQTRDLFYIWKYLDLNFFLCRKYSTHSIYLWKNSFRSERISQWAKMDCFHASRRSTCNRIGVDHRGLKLHCSIIVNIIFLLIE